MVTRASPCMPYNADTGRPYWATAESIYRIGTRTELTHGLSLRQALISLR